MADSDARRIWELYAAALKLEPKARREYLERACTDPAMRAQVEALLESGELELGTDTKMQIADGDVSLAGRQIGKYVIQRELGAFHPGKNRGVKQAGFRVLVGALMPAVLVEIAFISSPNESKLLGAPSFQDKIAYGLARSINNFFDTHEHLFTEPVVPR